MLIVHHLGKSQSERIVWLCEELAIPYELKRYDREAPMMMAPPEYKALHPMGAAPVITDGEVLLAESNAIVEYIMTTYAGERLSVGSGETNYSDYLYWLHFVNGTLQPRMGIGAMLKRSGLPDDHPMTLAMDHRRNQAIGLVEEKLGQTAYLAGATLTAADIMVVFTLTTMRYFAPLDLAPYPNILAYLDRISQRPAYHTAMSLGDPDMPLLLT